MSEQTACFFKRVAATLGWLTDSKWSLCQCELWYAHRELTCCILFRLLLLSQAGLSDYLDDSYDTFASRCYINKPTLKSTKRDRRPAPLSLYDLRGIFRTFAFAFLVGLIVFLCELVCGKWQSLYRNECWLGNFDKRVVAADPDLSRFITFKAKSAVSGLWWYQCGYFWWLI